MKLNNIPTLSTFDPAVSPLGKVSGGEVATPGDFPHYVDLHSPEFGGLFCGGAILSTYLILTAAHCLHGLNPGYMTVMAGVHNRKKRKISQQASYIQEFYIHENYTRRPGEGGPHDIALIVLSAPLEFTDEVKNISLPMPNEEFTGPVEIMGFAQTSSSQTSYKSEISLKVPVPIISYEECAANYSTINKYVTRSMFCAGLPEKDMCKENLGAGGLTVCKRANETEPILCGIASWRQSCGSEGFPGVNTKVSRYIDWIQDAAQVLANRRKCQTHEFSCSGTCIPRTKICDGTVDCNRGLDEMGCHNSFSNKTQCEKGELRCDNGNCVPQRDFCDGANDCLDNSDELKCPTYYFTCKETEVQCGPTGRCIPKEWKCDGRFDCDDLSDENESCPNFNSTAFQIQSATRTVNPPEDTGSCPSHEFYCPHHRLRDNCAPLSWRCDGYRDCRGGLDEANCSTTSAIVRDSICPSNKFYCPHPLLPDNCASISWLCDGDIDCLDGMDEAVCGSVPTTPAPSSPVGQCPPKDVNDLRFYCPGSRFEDSCAPLQWKCDGESDCTGGIDEEGCPQANPSTSHCELDEFYCPNSLLPKCIPLRHRCDGDDDCFGGYDEKDCNNDVEVDVVTAKLRAIPMTTTAKAPLHCASSEFQCADGSRCFPARFKCDGDRDCSDGSDEVSCSTFPDRNVTISDTPCPADKFECPIKGPLRACVPFSWKCDGHEDCPKGFDEMDCSSPSTKPEAIKETQGASKVNNGPIGYLFRHHEG